MEKLWRKYRDRGFSVIAIESSRNTERAKGFIEESDLTFHFVENEEENDVVGDTFKVNGFPTSFLVDGEGRIMYYHLGFSAGDEKEVEREIVELGLR